MNYLFCFLWLLFPVVWFFILKAANIKLARISIFIVVFYGIIFTQYIGLPILFFDLDQFRTEAVVDKDILLRVFLYTSLTIFLLLMGYVLAKKIFNIEIQSFHEKELSTVSKAQINRLIIITIVCFLVFFTYLSKIGKDNIALFSALGFVNSSASEYLRSAMGNSFEGKYHWYYLFMNRILLFSTYTFLGLKLLQPTKAISFYFYTTLIVLVFSLTVATEKGPISYFLISMFILYSVIKRNGSIPVKKLILLISFLMIMLTWFYMSFMHITNMNDAFLSIFSRFFTGQIQPVYHYLEFFPNVQDFLYGRSMTNPMGIFPFDSYNIALEVMAWYDSGQVTSGIVGSMPTIFWGELYANFGVYGILFITPFIGFLIHFVEIIFFKMQRNAITYALYVWVIMYLYNLNGTGLTSYILDIYPIFVLLAFFYLKGIRIKIV